MFERVLLPLDGSEVSAGIIPYLRQLARACGSRIMEVPSSAMVLTGAIAIRRSTGVPRWLPDCGSYRVPS